jgi:hypothetical protein
LRRHREAQRAKIEFDVDAATADSDDMSGTLTENKPEMAAAADD